ncbi:ATP-grasp domain-containing protein [Tumebacillus lipolyticus]|uniref:ATP-grasp domain-containing protein n=1 Tax=Tumebacillus lipolyticus TaxID=1280370 RepID=A0ABW5A331_9BACL
MTQQKAYIFCENLYPLVLARRAVYAKDAGYRTILISTELSAPEIKSLRDFEESKLEGKTVFDVMIPTDLFDLDTLRQHVAEIEKETPIGGFMCGIGTFHNGSLVGSNVSILAEERGLVSQNSDAVFRCNNKFLTRDALRAAGVPTVDFGMATDEETARVHASRIGYPVILKPVNGAASHMIVKCSNEEELVSKFRDAMERLPNSTNKGSYESAHSYPDRSGTVVHFDPMTSMLVEKYIPGREASVEMMITEDEYIPLLVHDKVTMSERERCFYEHLLVVPPQRFTQEEEQEMKDYAVAVAKAVGLKNSFSHVELRYGDDGMGPQLLEINPRIGGMWVQESIKALVGIDPQPIHVKMMDGTFTAESEYKSSDEIHAMFTIYPPHSGLLEKVDGLEELKQIPEMIHSKQAVPNGSVIYAEDEECFLVMCFIKTDSYERVYEIYEDACKMVSFTINQNVTSQEEVANA